MHEQYKLWATDVVTGHSQVGADIELAEMLAVGPEDAPAAAPASDDLPMWNTDDVLERLERYRQPFFAAGGLQFRETTALALLRRSSPPVPCPCRTRAFTQSS